MSNDKLKVIAKIYTDFPEKFGIPRQSGLVDNEGIIVFEPEYRNPDAVRGLEEFKYIWVLWEVSKSNCENWSPTVRPPRLGGNKRLGVFATRSPFRPNPIGLSSLKLLRVEISESKGPLIYVSGADMLNETPIYDIKPYLQYADSHEDANNGFTDATLGRLKSVDISKDLTKNISSKEISRIIDLLLEDPRPSYQDDRDRVYSMRYKQYEVKFKVKDRQVFVENILEY